MAKAENVDQYIAQHVKWKEELRILRNLHNFFPLEETIKWGAPVYTFKKKNLIGIGAFKHHYALWFFQGGLLQKNTPLLENAQEGKTQALRQIKFDENKVPNLSILRKYIEESLNLAKEGKKILQKNPLPVRVSEELTAILRSLPGLNEAFEKLSRGKQKEYHNYIAEAKMEKTKEARLKKILPLIQDGKGLNDKYRK